MAKKDKKSKKKQPGDWSDDEETTVPEPTPAKTKSAITPAAAAAAAANGASKHKPTNNYDDDEEEEEDDVDSVPAAKGVTRFSFADLGDANQDDDDDDDEDGLMAAVRASEKRKKDKKKSKKKSNAAFDDDDDNQGNEHAAGDGAEDDQDFASKAPVQMTAEQLMEEEFGPSSKSTKSSKGKKGKKGGKNKQQADEDFDEDAFLAEEAAKALALNGSAKPEQQAADDEDATTTMTKGAVKDTTAPSSTPAGADAAAAAAAGDEQGDEGVSKVLSKKEKERLKKEKEKAKKKAQAAAKKASAGGAKADGDDAPDAQEAETEAAPAPASASTAPAPDAEHDGEDGEEAGGAGGSSAKNKKKKKKGAAAPEAAAAAAAPSKAAPAKKVPAHIAAMRAALEKQKAAEEEARRKEEEERRRIEEEEARLAEIERQKEEEKKRKKEKENAKKEQLKREGKYMTPKQKQEAAAAKARRDAMIASGQIKVEGLEADAAADEEAAAAAAPRPKKVTYGKKKPQKKGPAGPASEKAETASPAPSSPVIEEPSKEEDPTREPEHEPSAKEDKHVHEDDVKDDWDAESAEEEADTAKPANAQEELDDWDAESDDGEEEEEKKKTPQKSDKAAVPAKAQTNGTVSAKASPAKPGQAGGAAKKASPAKAEEEEDEDDSDSDEDDDDDESSSEEDSDDDDSDEDDSDSDEEDEQVSKTKQLEAQRKAEAHARREQQRKDAIAAGSTDNLRSPICCILGHVDTGKTKLLDKIRQTNVQEGEAGGITQQIGATFFPMETIKQKTEVLGENNLKEYKLPGLLVIDTPGHESFTNLRTRGSSLCNIAILVVDIMHGLEPQTLESLRLLRTGKTPFIVALNKIDRLYGWEATPNGAFRDSLAKQARSVQNEFDKRLKETMLAFAEQGLNAVPYYENTNFAKNVSLVPTSAHTGEGVPDMLMLIIKLTQERMSSQLMYISELECTVLEVKVIEGLGTTLDVVLNNGILREGDKIVVCGLNGPIVTQVRALLTPQPLKELRIKGQYVHHQEVKAALGVKIVAPDLDKAIAGSRLLVCGPDDDEDDLKDEVMEELATIMKSIDRSGRGVYVQASTLGSLEALLEFLRTSKIPVSGINIGPVHKKDVSRCAVMLERAPEFAVLLAFDVDIDKEAAKMAEENNIKIFKADIIYHLFDAFTKHNAEILEAKRKDSAPNAVWPCRLKTLKVFAKRDPIILGCDILEGSLRVGTPLCVVKVDPETKKKEIIKLGKVTSLEINHKTQDVIKKSQVGAGVAVKIEHASYEPSRLFGRHFTEQDEIISLLTRQSLDVLKEVFRAEVPKEDWVLAKKLKPLLDIP